METFIDPEENAYPDGSLAKSRRRFRAVCESDGKARSGICGIPDTYFSIPAFVYQGKRRVYGWIYRKDDAVYFCANR